MSTQSKQIVPNPRIGDIVVWIARLVTLAFIVLLILFSFDAFSGDASFGKKLVGFLIHLVPAAAVGLGLFIAWKFPLPGGVLLLVLGMIFTIYFNTWEATQNFLLVSVPLFLAGVLFMLVHLFPKKKME